MYKHNLSYQLECFEELPWKQIRDLRVGETWSGKLNLLEEAAGPKSETSESTQEPSEGQTMLLLGLIRDQAEKIERGDFCVDVEFMTVPGRLASAGLFEDYTVEIDIIRPRNAVTGAVLALEGPDPIF